MRTTLLMSASPCLALRAVDRDVKRSGAGPEDGRPHRPATGPTDADAREFRREEGMVGGKRVRKNPKRSRPLSGAPMNIDLSGQTVLVTGASRGIGAAI